MPYNILITCLCNFTSPVVHLLCHLNGIAFPSEIERETWPKGCKTLLRQKKPEEKTAAYFA